MYAHRDCAGRFFWISSSSCALYSFAQILFIGPANREDMGFDHSYDVLVDTYQAAEDLSDPEDYKIGGRMAHHMLYTALQEHPCYDGYLWAPFDTLLNIPRLQLFDQSKFWYHSPFGRYVPNPALDPSAIGNASFHAPAANISPDPARMTTPWKGWSADWWYVNSLLPLSFCHFYSPRDFLLHPQVGVRSLARSRLREILHLDNIVFALTFAGRLMSGCPFAWRHITRSPRRSAIASPRSPETAIASSAGPPTRCTSPDGTATPSCPPSRSSSKPTVSSRSQRPPRYTWPSHPTRKFSS